MEGFLTRCGLIGTSQGTRCAQKECGYMLYVDANHTGKKLNRRSHTGIIIDVPLDELMVPADAI